MLRSLLNPVIHLIISIIFGFLIINAKWAFTTEFFAVFLGFSISISALTFSYSFERNLWKNYIASIGIFVLLILLIGIFQISTGNPNNNVSGNMADGLVLLVVLFLSFLSIIVGNLIGIFTKMYFSKKN